jgi:hypothetical protein
MAVAYQKFLRYLFIENAGDEALQRSMNEVRIKFLSLYFATHAPVAPIFNHRPKSLHRRYIIADYFSGDALKQLRAYPKVKELAFEHVVPKDGLRQVCEATVRDGKELVSIDEIKKMLDETWHIAVVAKHEDRMLTPQKVMPLGWKRGDDILARYRSEPGGRDLRFDLYRANEDAEQCRFILNS